MLTHLPLETARYGITALARAFGHDARSLRKRLDAAGYAMEGDGWTVRQVHEALSGDGSLEALRASRKELQDAQAELARNQLRQQEAELVDAKEFSREYERVAVGIIRVIEASNLSDQDKDSIRLELSKLHEP